MTRLFTLASIVVHAIVIAVVFVAQLVAVGPLPTPRRALIFESPGLITRVDIQLPAPHVTRSGETAASATLTAAPTTEPTGVRDETGHENDKTEALDADAAIGVEHGSGNMSSIGVAEGVTLPPPPPPPPPAPVRLHAGIVPPQKTVHITPVYPSLARASRVQGVVILEAVIDVNGNVQSAQVLRSIPLLDQAALDAVRQWRFTPARLNGAVIPVVMTVTVNFSLTNP